MRRLYKADRQYVFRSGRKWRAHGRPSRVRRRSTHSVTRERSLNAVARYRVKEILNINLEKESVANVIVQSGYVAAGGKMVEIIRECNCAPDKVYYLIAATSAAFRRLVDELPARFK